MIRPDRTGHRRRAVQPGQGGRRPVQIVEIVVGRGRRHADIPVGPPVVSSGTGVGAGLAHPHILPHVGPLPYCSFRGDPELAGPAMRQDELVSSDAPPSALVAPVEQVVEIPSSPVVIYPSPVELDDAAIARARAAATAAAQNAAHVGDFVSCFAEDDVAVTAMFAARQPGYVGWHWSVTLAVVSPDPPTVSEVVLLPGEGALLAPVWIPWEQRIRPGDVGVGDLLPPVENDPRLVPAYVQSEDPAVEAVARELGVGRVHVLSREGRVDFAERLRDSRFGPEDEMALAAPAPCFSCAFYLPLAGSLGQLVGACGNDLSPADGRVVDAAYGCGAHSETVIDMPARSATALAVIDEITLEIHRRPRSAAHDASILPLAADDAFTLPLAADDASILPPAADDASSLPPAADERATDEQQIAAPDIPASTPTAGS